MTNVTILKTPLLYRILCFDASWALQEYYLNVASWKVTLGTLVQKYFSSTLHWTWFLWHSSTEEFCD